MLEHYLNSLSGRRRVQIVIYKHLLYQFFSDCYKVSLTLETAIYYEIFID